jgi:hypothetical protein
LTRWALAGRGLRLADLPVLSDVDCWDDALAVAESAPGTRFAAAVAHHGGYRLVDAELERR